MRLLQNETTAPMLIKYAAKTITMYTICAALRFALVYCGLM